MTFTIFVPGIPKPQLRGRAFVYQKGGKARVGVYDPTPSHDWKGEVNHCVRAKAVATDFKPLEGAVILHLHFELPRPKSLLKKILHHVRRPDVDNLAKAVKDAIRGLVYLDDSQVVELRVAKMYSETPGVGIWASGCHSDDDREPVAEADAAERFSRDCAARRAGK